MTITDFAALTIRLPLLDRATLSQAWRDALHATHLRPINGAARSLSASASAQTRPAAQPIGRSRPPMRTVMLTSRSTPRARSAFVPGAQRIPAAARSRCVGSPGRMTSLEAVFREQFSVTLANGERLCVLVASGRHGLIVTLLCAAHLRDEMCRALARLATDLVATPIQVRVVDAMEVGLWRA